MVAEQIHRYPFWLRSVIEVLCALIVVIAACLAGHDFLIYLWTVRGLDMALAPTLPWLTNLVILLGGGTTGQRMHELSGLLPSLGWLLLALLLSLLARNSLPVVRTSPRGMLVEFAGGWLPIPWESLTAIKVTEDFGAERFVLLAETERGKLTGWHRLYSFLYRFGFRRGFLITSAISNFDGLVQTLLSETDRVARVLDRVNTVKLQEDATSPLFRLLLGPASFFSRRDTTDSTPQTPSAVAAPISAAAPGSTVQGTYPARITALFHWGAALLALLAVVRYVVLWLEFLALQFPDLRNQPVFNRLTLTVGQTVAPWWALVAALLMLVIVFVVLLGLRHLLPALEARSEGLAIRHFNRWIVLPWERVNLLKVTDLAEDSQVVFIQAKNGLPFSTRLAGLLYDGSPKPGVLLTSAISNFEPLLQRVVLGVTRAQHLNDIEGSPLFQEEARSALLYTSLRAAGAIDQFVETAREDDATLKAHTPAMLRAAAIMLPIAAMPALLAVADRVFRQAVLPMPSLLVTIVVLLVVGMLEWPVVALAASVYDDMTGGGEEGNRPFYLYPLTQLPRLIPLGFAVLFMLIGVPVAPMLLWLTAAAWSFLLATGLWGALYDWRGSQLIVGGLIPLIFQLLIMLAYLLVLR